MLEDRQYMRRPGFEPRRSVTVLLVAANVAAFLVQWAALEFTHFPVYRYLALSVEGLRHGYVWQLLTYQFLHAGLFHLAMNCIGLFMFGREVEEALGRRSFFALYLASGIMGGLVHALAGALLGGRFLVGVVGASAGVFGVVAAFAMLYPERPLMLFPIPITIRAKFLLAFEVCLAVGLLVFPLSQDVIAHTAHLGGILAGVLFVRYAAHWNLSWPQSRPARRTPMRRLVSVPSQASTAWAREKIPPQEELSPEEFLSKEVDPILDKISAHGIQSLTEREKRILEAATKKVPRR